MIDNSIEYLTNEIIESGEKIESKLRSKGIDVTFGKHSEGKTDLTEIVDIAINNIGGGSVDIVTEWEEELSDEKVPSEKLVKDTLDTKADINNLSTVATSGSYNDLSNKPSIPSSSDIYEIIAELEELSDSVSALTDNVHVELSCSNYKPSIDGEVLVTAKVTDNTGEVVVDYPVELYRGNYLEDSGVTDEAGEYTYTYTASEWGLQVFTVGGAHIALEVTGFKKVQESSDGYLTVYYNGRTVRVRINLRAKWYNNHSSHTVGTIDEAYRPLNYLNKFSGKSTNTDDIVGFYEISTAGVVQVTSLIDSHTYADPGALYNAVFEYTIK